MRLAVWTILVYGVIIAIGGFAGYLMRGGLALLIAGVLGALPLWGLGAVALKGRIEAAYAGGSVTFLLAIYYAYRFIASAQFVPSGVLLIISFFALFLTILGVFLELSQSHPSGQAPG